MLPISDNDRRIALLVILNVVLAATLGTAVTSGQQPVFVSRHLLKAGNVDIFS